MLWRRVTAEGTGATGGLRGAKHTMLHPFFDIALLFRATGAQGRPLSSVPFTTVDMEQRRQDTTLSLKTLSHGGHQNETSLRYNGEPVSCDGEEIS